MSETVVGVVQAISSKKLASGTYFSFCVDDVWYRTARDRPEFDKGYTVKFTFTEDKWGKHVDLSELKSKEGDPSDAPASSKAKGSRPKSSSAFWENKEVRDIETQKRISFQAAANTAVNIVNGALDRELLPLPKGKVGDKFALYQGMLMEETVRMYKLYQEAPDKSEDYLRVEEVEVKEDFLESEQQSEPQSEQELEDEWN